MNEKFISHVFKKVCSESRGRGLDKLIGMAVKQNTDRLRGLVNDENYAWILETLDVNALFFALSQLQDYYDGGAVSDEQWVLTSYYAFNKLEALDGELLKSIH